MKRINAKTLLLICVLLVSLLLSGCSDNIAGDTPVAGGDIVILYTNDVHCGISDGIGYSALAAYRAQLLEKTPYVALVDCGDAVQGSLIGTVSRGEFIIDIMNDVGYDYAIPGNHEFDYGLEQLSYLAESAAFDYLCCNVSYSGSGENLLSWVEPYDVRDYGGVSVGFVGVSTPYSIINSTPKYFTDENGEFVYDFCRSDADTFYACVQSAVDGCIAEGADYVVLLTHLGDGEAFSPFSSPDLIHNTVGVDAVLDGHAHSEIPCCVQRNKNGEDVLLSSAGTKFSNFGQLIITENGLISAGLISDYTGSDADIDVLLENIYATFEAETSETVAHSDIALSCCDDDGIRMVRSRETAIGNFCADAYRTVACADVAFVNGGGIRADLPFGDITYADLLAVHPYGNTLCMVEATGQEILDALELSARFVQSEYKRDGNACGESGGFLQVSGIRYVIDPSIDSAVVVDENDMFVSVDGEYRVRDVEILGSDGVYAPIDLAKTYTVASHNYIIKGSGNGYCMFADNSLLIDEGMSDYQILISYITEALDGHLAAYSGTEGRITFDID